MENASKALIIAGAILLSILIIGLGMMIFSQAQDAISDTGMTEQQIATYNAKFTNYEGTQSGSSVRTLINTVISHNATNVDDPSLQVGIEADGIGTNGTQTDDLDVVIDASVLRAYRNTISAGKRYTVECPLSKAGRVMNIKITDADSTPTNT